MLSYRVDPSQVSAVDPTVKGADMSEGQKRLVRPQRGRRLAGVCVGLAEYFEVKASRVRFGFVLFGLFGAGEIVYIALWIILPKAP